MQSFSHRDVKFDNVSVTVTLYLCINCGVFSSKCAGPVVPSPTYALLDAAEL